MTRLGLIGGVALIGAMAAPALGQTLADREAVEAALARYTNGLDRLDADLYVSALAPDAVVAIEADEIRGHAALRKVIADEAALRAETPRTLYHMETNSSIRFTAPDRAVHESYWLTMSQTGAGADGLALFDVGSLTDDLQKIDGEWLIVRREIRRGP